MSMRFGLGLGLGAVTAGGSSMPSWVLTSGGIAAACDVDIIGDRAVRNGVAQTVAAQLTLTRASPGYYENFDGTLTLFGVNVPRYGNRGLLCEPSRTNPVLHNRDLTDAAWVKVTVTAAKDQVGPDGVSNSASSLTATAGNATCLQPIVLASSARWQTAYVKRLTGSGTINMTMDGGLTWTAVSVTSAWTRVHIPSQTLANPTVGFRIVTNGDAIAIWGVQNEASGISSTSPIDTTTVAVTRAADGVLVANYTEFYNAAEGTIFCDCISPEDNNASFWALSDGTTTNMISNRVAAQTSQYYAIVAGANQGITNGPNMVIGDPYRSVCAYKLNDAAISANDTTAAVDATIAVPSITQFAIGLEPGGVMLNGYCRRIAYWPTRLSNAELLRLSRSNISSIFLVEGHSIPNAPAAATGFPAIIRAREPPRWFLQNNAVASSRIVYIPNSALDMTTRGAALDAVLIKYVASNPGAKKATVIMIGVNDITDGVANATILTELAAYGDARRAAGHYVGFCTITPSTIAGVNTNRALINPSIRAMVGVHCDFILDFDTTAMGADSDASDTAKYADGLHPTAAGSVILAAYGKTVLDAL